MGLSRIGFLITPLLKHVKQKQKGAERLLLPSVEGHQSGKWIVIDSGKVIIHALDEKARAYYNLESLWTTELSTNTHNQVDTGPWFRKQGARGVFVIGAPLPSNRLDTERRDGTWECICSPG
ncbi:Protein Iojap/ribosomal silencing factor RsfS [Macleaya cordata]|uniref:Protein Iojap/ribosomal silencing factor RsfS n=1 Tax=Macleaya cordata TaxID=56857 RepID=A0A200QYB0_MACCD|nr:Protein Iojap/ribosomal silencing factor RsfS [Macleaya cordata]